MQSCVQNRCVDREMRFSGGAVNESGMVPAIYSTKNPITQVIIENSDSFKSGRIRLQSVIQENRTRKRNRKTANRNTGRMTFLK